MAVTHLDGFKSKYLTNVEKRIVEDSHVSDDDIEKGCDTNSSLPDIFPLL